MNLETAIIDKLNEMKISNYSPLELINLCADISRIIVNKKKNQSAFIVAISGAQGAGKTTLANILKIVLEKQFNFRVVSFSLDDYYLSQKERLELARNISALLQTRGVPGTHNIPLLIKTLQDLKNNIIDFPITICKFDKKTDNPSPKQQYQKINYKPDIILFDGWCLGAKPQTEKELLIPINQLEAEEDKDLTWRRFVNQQLATNYKELFAMIDFQIFLKIPFFDKVYQWRLKQEEKLIDNFSDSTILLQADNMHRFISHFERITRSMLLDAALYSDVILNVNHNQNITDYVMP